MLQRRRCYRAEAFVEPVVVDGDDALVVAFEQRLGLLERDDRLTRVLLEPVDHLLKLQPAELLLLGLDAALRAAPLLHPPFVLTVHVVVRNVLLHGERCEKQTNKKNNFNVDTWYNLFLPQTAGIQCVKCFSL